MKKTKRSIKWFETKNISKRKFVGTHLLAEFWHGKIIEDPKKMRQILFLAAKKTGNTPLKTTIHKFSPQGMTGIILLAESHIAIHSWPEINYLAIDIFTCGQRTKPEEAINYFKKIFKPKKIEIKKIKRGRIS